MDQPQRVSIDFTIGFGMVCFDPGVAVGAGTKHLVYRYIPSPLWGTGIRQNIAHINRAANAFETYDQLPSDLRPPFEVEPADELTPQGWALYQTFPIYAELEIGVGILTWTQYYPDGELAYVGQGSKYEEVVDAALRNFPIDQWADLFLGDLRKMITPLPDGAQPAILMRMDKGSEVPVVAEAEAIVRPLGVRKVMKVACPLHRVEACQKMTNFNENFHLRECAMAVRFEREMPWDWREHHVWWFDMPLQFLPRMLRWVEAEDARDPAPYATQSIAPANEPLVPEVRLNGDPDPRPWDMVAVFFQPLSEIGENQRAFHEDSLDELIAG